MSLDRSKYYGHWVPLSCYDIKRLDRIAVQSSDPNVRKEYASRLIHFYNNTHPITHVRLTGSVMSVNVRTINNDLHGKLSVSLEVDDGSGELVTASFLWNGDMESTRARYEKLLHKTVSVRGTPFTRFWNEGKVVSLDLKAVDLLDFAGEMEAIDNRMYTLEQLNLSPTFDYTRELPEKEKPEVKFLDYEVMSFKNAVSFTDVEKGEVVEHTKEGEKTQKRNGADKKEKGEELESKEGSKELETHDNDKKKGMMDVGKESKVQSIPQYPNLAHLFKLPSAGKVPKTIKLPQEVVVIDEDEDEGRDDTGAHTEVSESHTEANGDASGAEAGGETNVDADADLESDSNADIDANTDPEVVVIEDEEEEEEEEAEVDTVEDERNEPAESDDEFGIMNKFQFVKSTSPEARSRTSSSPVVVGFGSSLSMDSPRTMSPETTTKPSQSPGKTPSKSHRRIALEKQSPTSRGLRPKFKNTVIPALKRRKYTPDMA